MENNDFVIENNVLKSYVGSDTCVNIPESISKIGKDAFSGNNKIKEVVFPQNSLKSIETGAFASCKSIKNLMLPKGLLQIGDNAFMDCTALEYVFIPDSVVLIGENLFGSNHSVIILGVTGSEAEKYANDNLPKLSFSTNISAISAAKKAPVKKAQTKVFDIFGEEIKCSNTLSYFHDALEYWESRKDALFERVIDALPLEINADISKVLNVQNYLNQEDLSLIKRIEKKGFIISKGEIAVHTGETSISMIEATKAIAEFFSNTSIYKHNTIQDQANQLQQAAENSVTGLSYGIIGSSFDMAIYALDDFRARQKQRCEAYAKAEAKLASFKETLTTTIQKEYTQIVSDKIPVIRKLTDNYITALRNAEIEKLVDVGVLDRNAVNVIDLEKSSQLFQKALTSKADDKTFLIAKSLEKYPCNCAAIVHALEQGLTCDGLEQLVAFIGLQKIINHTISANKASRHAEHYEKVAKSLSSAEYQHSILKLIKEEKEFSEEEIKNLLQLPISSISTKLLSAVQEYTPEQYAQIKLNAILPEVQWDFYMQYGIIPFNNKEIPSDGFKSYADLLTWFQSKIQSKEDSYIRACTMLESRKSLSEAIDIFHDLSNYRISKVKCDEASKLLKKKNRKITIISLASFFVLIIVSVLYSYCIAPQIKAQKAAERYIAELPGLQIAQVGDVVTFGNYQGKDIEWVVYEKSIDENETINLSMLSRYVLFEKAYGWGEYKWDGSYEHELNSWIKKEEFVNSIFGIDEQGIIKNDLYGNVSLAIPYWSHISRITETIPTYIIGFDKSGKTACDWWTSSTDYGTNNITFYNVEGNEQKTSSKTTARGVRPVVVITISKVDTWRNDLVIPDGVTSIASSAFSGYAGLTSVTIPDSVTRIGSFAFENCKRLTSVTIPNSVTSIDQAVFSGCTSLTSVIIPNSVTSIGSFAFENCKSLTSVTIPDSVTNIDWNAFSGCTCLTSVTIPNSVTSIDQAVFSSCTSLTSVIIPNSVTSIGHEAFSGCTSLNSVTIPNSVTSIDGRAFLNCTELTSISYTGDIAGWCNISGLSNLMSYGSSSKELYFNGVLLTDLTIPDNVTSIAYNAFMNCTCLTSVTIPDSVTNIGWNAFSGCTNLTSVTFTGTRAQWDAIYNKISWEDCHFTLVCTG